ncbi:MAG: hypothetical protein AB8B99_11030 [Phormidesmis sp.]
MKFNRVVIELMLVVGAIAGVASVVSAQLPGYRSSQSEQTSAQTIQLSADNADDLAWLGNLVGIAQFVQNPTQYSFACGEAPGQVTDASLEGDVMTIAFRYPSDGEVRTGELTGTVDAEGLFVGTYQTQSQQGVLKGDVTMTFVADGTAEGSYGNGVGTTRIFL